MCWQVGGFREEPPVATACLCPFTRGTGVQFRLGKQALTHPWADTAPHPPCPGHCTTSKAAGLQAKQDPFSCGWKPQGSSFLTAPLHHLLGNSLQLSLLSLVVRLSSLQTWAKKTVTALFPGSNCFLLHQRAAAAFSSAAKGLKESRRGGESCSPPPTLTFPQVWRLTPKYGDCLTGPTGNENRADGSREHRLIASVSPFLVA